MHMSRASDIAVKDYIATATLEELESLTKAIITRKLELPPKGKYDTALAFASAMLTPSNKQTPEQRELLRIGRILAEKPRGLKLVKKPEE